jgi:hypothetical protein
MRCDQLVVANFCIRGYRESGIFPCYMVFSGKKLIKD